jgi:hypothetical protein
MKLKLVLLLLMIMSAGIIGAQDVEQKSRQGRQRLTVEERVKAQTDQMKKDFDLTDAQYDSVWVINLKYAKKAEEFIKNNQTVRAENRELLKKGKEEKENELKSILSESQYRKYEEQLKTHRSKVVKQIREHRQRPQRRKE